jgi:hypothetical protein
MKTVRRLLVLLAGMVGLLAILQTAAYAGFGFGNNHTEPLRRR